MRKKYTDDFLIETLRKYAINIGKTPTYNVFENDKTVPSAAIYKARFGNWNNAIVLAGLKTNGIRKFKKEDIINEVLNYYEKYGRAPHYNELNYTSVHVNKYWEGWTAMLEDLNLPLNRRFSSVTDEDGLLDFLKQLADKLDAIPTGRDIEVAGVNRNLFTQKFGSYKTALIMAGVVDSEYFKSMEDRVPESIEAIATYYKENGEAPTVEEYEAIAKRENLAHRKALEMVLEKRFSEICMEHIGVANQYGRGKEQLLEDLIQLKEKLGRIPLTNELVKHGLAEIKQYYRTFEMSYTQIVQSLGWEPPYKRIYKSIDELLEDYSKLYKELGRIPFYEDINKEEWMAHSATYKNHFEDLPTIWESLDIIVDNVIIEKSYGTGTTCIDKNGQICRSYTEMIITNLLIDLELKFEKNISYKKHIPDLERKIDADWFLTDSSILIEFFGLFSKKQLHQENFIGKYSRDVLYKLSLCEQYNISIIDLYPKDVADIEGILMKKLLEYKVI
ncbi:homing endonuclease associated repeat-containing protein [Sporosarcina psychrophila]|uniref:Uncharacterized protein n=1 Tax=Sporosarcina psychrophila TaxID=1476 RepID=A0ABV2KDK2_SPOPS